MWHHSCLLADREAAPSWIYLARIPDTEEGGPADVIPATLPRPASQAFLATLPAFVRQLVNSRETTPCKLHFDYATASNMMHGNPIERTSSVCQKGSRFDPLSCLAYNLAWAFYGHSGGFLDENEEPLFLSRRIVLLLQVQQNVK